jgi:anti-anti-sigma regulatory factor
MPEAKFFTTDSRGDVLVIRFPPGSQLSGSVAGPVGDQLFKLVDEGGWRQLLLNFANVSGVTSLFIGKLITLHKKVQPVGGWVGICEASPVVLEILDLLRLTTMIPAYPTEQEAMNSLP